MATVAGLDNLPVVLVHRILDCLDIRNIFRSLRGVCRRLNLILDKYNRYKFNFKSISKNDFHLICQLISPKQVVSLTLSDCNDTPGQIQLFLSSFKMNQFIRLHSLTLCKIDEPLLKTILTVTSLASLKCLSIDCRGECPDETLDLLGIFLTEHPVRKLSLSSSSLCNILLQCDTANMRHLSLNACTVNQIQHVLSSASSLEALILTDVQSSDRDNLPNLDSLLTPVKLTYMSISSSSVKMAMLEEILRWLFNSSKQLRRLRVISNANDENYFDGARWESLLTTTQLTHCQFRFDARLITTTSLSEILLPFRSHFWLEKKRWFVACDQHRLSNESCLYSTPWCHGHFIWQSLGSFTSENTLSASVHSIFKRVTHLQIKLSYPSFESYASPDPRFPNVSSLELESNDRQYMLSSLNPISSLNVMISRLLHLVLSTRIRLRILSFIFQQTPSLRALTTRKYPVLCYIRAINNREMMNRIRLLALHEELRDEHEIKWLCKSFNRVEHLHVNVSSVKHMRTICSRLQFHLLTVHFLCSSIAKTKVRLANNTASFINWLRMQQWHFIFRIENELICVWLSDRQVRGWWSKKRRLSFLTNDHQPKRIKFDEN